jgi:hypothetical protein
VLIKNNGTISLKEISASSCRLLKAVNMQNELVFPNHDKLHVSMQIHEKNSLEVTGQFKIFRLFSNASNVPSVLIFGCVHLF